MKAITVWQPWATLIAYEVKPYEFRHWAAPESIVGQRIAIHAGAREWRKAEIKKLLLDLQNDQPGTALKPDAIPILDRMLSDPWRTLPRSAIVCTAVLGEPRKATSLFGRKVADSDRIDRHIWAWPLTEVKLFMPPIEAKGFQGFWNWREES